MTGLIYLAGSCPFRERGGGVSEGSGAGFMGGVCAREVGSDFTRGAPEGGPVATGAAWEGEGRGGAAEGSAEVGWGLAAAEGVCWGGAVVDGLLGAAAYGA